MVRNQRRSWTEFWSETGYVARIYLDSLRDNFVGYTPVDQRRFDALKDEFDALASHHAGNPYFADLLRIEMALVDVMPDDVVLARFWAVDDRFRRVVPLATRDRYDRSVPPRGDACWANAGFVKNQTRTLLDVVHSNYLLNIGREKSLKRLKAIMWITGVGCLLVELVIHWLLPDDGTTGRLPLVACGVFGALLSITNRMQAAVSPDAMTQDGIYELTGLRVGWVGVLMSLILGGGFAIVLYLIVMAGALDVAYPKIDSTVAGTGDASENPPSPTASGSAASSPTATPTSGGSTGTPPVAPPAATSRATTTSSNAKPKTPGAGDAANPLAAQTCTDPGGCPYWASRIGRRLGFRTAADFFRMLVLAFLAGFAERFVPDILNRLSKQKEK